MDFHFDTQIGNGNPVNQTPRSNPHILLGRKLSPLSRHSQILLLGYMLTEQEEISNAH
jgi:hypothetical protein